MGGPGFYFCSKNLSRMLVNPKSIKYTYDFLLVFAKKEVIFFTTFVPLQYSHLIFGFPSTSLIVRYTVKSLLHLLQLYSYDGILTSSLFVSRVDEVFNYFYHNNSICFKKIILLQYPFYILFIDRAVNSKGEIFLLDQFIDEVFDLFERDGFNLTNDLLR